MKALIILEVSLAPLARWSATPLRCLMSVSLSLAGIRVQLVFASINLGLLQELSQGIPTMTVSVCADSILLKYRV